MVNEFDFLHSSFENDSSDNLNSSSDLPSIYIVEDDLMLGRTIKKYIEKVLTLKVHYFSGPEELLSHFKENSVAKFCLISDISFGEGSSDGLWLVDSLKEKGLNFTCILMTGFASIETAIAATKKGVYHYLTKPFELNVLTKLLTEVLVNKFDLESNSFLKEEIETNLSQSKSNDRSSKFKVKIERPTQEDMFCGMIGRSKKMKMIFERIKKVANADSTVLITGPSGTGKELVSNAIHMLSNRARGPKISVNCGAIPSELLESELFGHIKGSFTGAISDRKGRFELANNGSIFLDEIGDMPLLLQVKLLRVLQNREIEKVGGSQHMPIDVRIITATHRDLEAEVVNGNFREDLYYRLNVIPVKIPSLAERREDIPLLISYFLSRFVSADGRNAIEFSDDVLEILYGYNWPGNVRELENLIERLVILRGGGAIRIEDLPAKFLTGNSALERTYDELISLPVDGLNLKDFLSTIEDSLIQQALEKTGGNKNQASKLLCLNRTTLIEKMKKKGLLVIQPTV